MEIILKTVASVFIMVLFLKIVNAMKKKNFFFIEEIANIMIDIFKTVFALLKAIIKLSEDLTK